MLQTSKALGSRVTTLHINISNKRRAIAPLLLLSTKVTELLSTIEYSTIQDTIDDSHVQILFTTFVFKFQLILLYYSKYMFFKGHIFI